MGRKRTGSLSQIDGVWHARVTERGERPVYCLETRDEPTARRKLRELLARIEREEREGADRRRMPSFEDAAREWLDSRAAKGKAVDSDRALFERYAFPEMGDVLLGDVVPGHVRRALDRCLAAGRKRGTLKHLHNAIRGVLHVAWQDGFCRENAALRVPIPETREVSKVRCVLTDAELGQLWAAPVDLEIRLLSVVARVEGGMRTRDLVAWDWEHVDLEAFSWCIVPRTKTAKPQRLEIPAALKPALLDWWELQGSPTSGPVFPVTRRWHRGEDRTGQRRAARGVSFADRLRRALCAAGVFRAPPIEVPDLRPGRRTDLGKAPPMKLGPSPKDPLYYETADTLPVDFHSFRRAFAQALDDAADVSRKQAMALTGHGSEDAHLRYLARAGRTVEVLALPVAVVPPLLPPKKEEDS